MGGTYSTSVNESNVDVTTTYKVKLASKPYPDSGTVAVAINVPTGTDVSVTTPSTASYTFDKDNWNTEQSVVLTVEADADAVDDDVTITHTVTNNGADYGGVSGPNLDLRVTDDETANLVFSNTTVSVNETDADVTATYTVKLSTQPTAAVMLTLTSNNSDVTIDTDTVMPADQNTLTFSTTNWSIAQTVTLTVSDDADAADDVATISHLASGGDYAGKSGDVTVNVTDNEVRGVTPSFTQSSLAEGGNSAVFFTLDTQPTSTVTIVASIDPSDSSIRLTGSTTMTFTPTDYANNLLSNHRIQIRANGDANGEDEAATVRFVVTGGDYDGVTVPEISVTSRDDDDKGIEFNAGLLDEPVTQTINVTEGRINRRFGIRLLTEPTGDVEITPVLASNSRLGFVDSDPTLTFTMDNWDDWQTIGFNAAEDDDGRNDRWEIDFNISGYGTLDSSEEPDPVIVNVADNDSAEVVLGGSFVNGSIEVAEGNTTGSAFTMVLTTKPVDVGTGANSSTTIGFTVPTGLTVTPSSWTFNSGNWSNPKEFRVTAANDPDGVNNEYSVSSSMTGADYNGSSPDPVEIRVIDDDEPMLDISQTSVTVDETATLMNAYTVKPTTQPTGTFTVALASNSSKVTVSPLILTFTAGDWETAQPVQLFAVDDDDAFDDTAMITHTASMSSGQDEYDGVTGTAVTVTADDDDTQGVNVVPTALTITEGNDAEYTISLDTLPVDTNGVASTVTVTLTNPSNTDISGSPTTVTLNSGNWQSGVPVTVEVAEDADTTADMETITHAVSGADYGGESAASVTVTATDNDTVGVDIPTTAITPTEGGTATYTVELLTQPTGTVTVTMSSDNSDVTLSHSSLTFTGTTWNTAETVTVTAAEDADAAEDTAVITHSVSGAEYDSAPTPAPVNVTVTENDSLGITVSPTTLTITEVEGATGTDDYEVTLAAAPTGGSVTIQITRSGDTNVTTNPSSLTFSANDWELPTSPSFTQNVSKTVTVNVSDDADAVVDMATLTHSITGSNYQSDGIPADPVTVNVTDTDTAGVTVSESTLTIAEGSTGTYTIVLDTEPTGDVTVQINDPSNTVITADESSLTFTPMNWSTPQPVTVNALDDPDANEDIGTITHEITTGPGEYPTALTIASVDVTATDGNTRGVEITETALEIEEGGTTTATYQVRLDTEPNGTVTITPSSDNPDVSIDPTSRSFNDTDWMDFKTFAVESIQDADAAADEAVISHAVSGADYGTNNVTAASVDVTVFDADNASASASTDEVTVTEGQGAAYTIVLDSRPVGGSVTVALSLTSSSSPDISIDKTQLTFTSGDWNEAQTITVTAADDTDTRPDAGTITHEVSGANFLGATIPNVAVFVTEDDMAMISIDPTAITVGEGNSATYTVVLGTEPSGDVTITSGSNNSDVTISPTSLTFNAAATADDPWNTPQLVTVSASSDSDATNDDATISHTVRGHEYEGEMATNVTVLVVEDGSSVPDTTSYLRSSSCDNKLLLSWNSPTAGEVIESFTIQWATGDTAFNASDMVSVDGGEAMYSLGPLNNGTAYRIQMIGLTSAGYPVWLRGITATPSDTSCISDVKFGNILADSTPVIVKVENEAPGTQVNLRHRSLNPGVWSEVQSQIIEPGEDSVTFDIRGLRPSAEYEVQTWLGSAIPPAPETSTSPESSAAQAVFTTGEVPEGAIFRGGGGGSRGGRILRIESGIRSVTVGLGDEVSLSVEVWGRQEIQDNGLADKDPADGRPSFTWVTNNGGTFSEADIRSDWKNGSADDRTVNFTAPEHPATITIGVSLDGATACLATRDDETSDDQAARCSARIEVVVQRSLSVTTVTTAPVNPPGPIPEVLSDSAGVAHAVFTPVEGGSFVGEGYSVSAGPGAVANAEFIGLSMAPIGDASNIGSTWHRYTLAGQIYAIGAVDASGTTVSSYAFGEPVVVCVPMPNELRGSIADIVLTSTQGEVNDTTVLSTRIRILPVGGVQVCGNLSTVPANVAVGKVGSPPEIEDPDAAAGSGEPLPDTGGAQPMLLLLYLLALLGIATSLAGTMYIRRVRQRS